MTKREELADRLEELSALEPGWYANVGKRTGERCCEAMRQAAALLRQEPSVEEIETLAVSRLIEFANDVEGASRCRRITLACERSKSLAEAIRELWRRAG